MLQHYLHLTIGHGDRGPPSYGYRYPSTEEDSPENRIGGPASHPTPSQHQGWDTAWSPPPHHLITRWLPREPQPDTLDPLAALGDQLASLFTNIATPTPLVQLPQTQLPPGSLSGERVDLNLLHYLLPNQRAKFKDICDYVQEGIDQQEEVVGRGEGTEFVVRTSIRKVKLEQVSPMHWSAANIRILMDLLHKGELQPKGILDYLAYTVMYGHRSCSGIGRIGTYSNRWAFAGGVTLPISLLSLCFPGSLCLPRRPGHSLRGPVLPKLMLSPSATITTRVNVNIRRSATLGMSACSQAERNLIRQHSTYPQKCLRVGPHNPLLRPPPCPSPPHSTSLLGSMK